MLPFIYLDNAKIKLIPINEAKTIHYLSLNIFTKEESYKFIGFKNKIEKINDWTYFTKYKLGYTKPTRYIKKIFCVGII